MSFAHLEAFTIPDTLKIAGGHNGLPKLLITSPLANAEIYLLGAHVTAFKPAGAAQMLWVSPKSPFMEGKGIRGGVPICWPWFGPHKVDKTQSTHGFARMRSWNLLSTARLHDGQVQVVLGLESNEHTLAIFSHQFSLRATITVGTSLNVELAVSNTGKDAFSFDNCYHSYFAVQDAAKATVAGARGTPCLDRHKGDTHSIQDGPVAFDGEIIKVLEIGDSPLTVEDPAGRRILASSRNAQQTVIWNPGAANAAKMPEIESHWAEFVCVEAANCLSHPVHLAPGLSHSSAVNYRMQAD